MSDRAFAAALLEAVRVRGRRDGAMISDATWSTLARRLDEKKLFELPVLVGQFTNVAYFQNALRLRLADGNLGLRAR